MSAELILRIRKVETGYLWVLFHEDGIQSIDQGEKASIAAALKSAFSYLSVGEEVDVNLTMEPRQEEFEYYEADMPPMKSGGMRMAKGSETPDFERGARLLLGALR